MVFPFFFPAIKNKEITMQPKFKPNQQVIVQEKGYSYIGEVMSFETPDHAVMVRRVPGHPGTLEKMPVAKLTPVPKAEEARFVHYAEIDSDGRGQFPVDMLRYDQAAPVNFKLVARSRFSGGFEASEVNPSFGFKGLVVATVTRWRDTPWTPERWRSFMWRIRPLKTERI